MSSDHKKIKPFTHSKTYRNFSKDVDRALERILHVHLSAVDQIIGKLKTKVLALLSLRLAEESFRVHGMGPIKHELMLASVQTSEMAKRLRSPVYLLAHAGEAEAMARALGREQTSHARVKSHAQKAAPSGGSIDDRIMLYFERLARDIQDALQTARVLDESPHARVAKKFPETRQLKKTQALTSKRKLREDSDGLKQSQIKWVPKMSVGISDDEMWDAIIEDYRSTTLPPSIFKRGPLDKTLYYDVDTLEGHERYTWEVEQEIAEDFVRSVRSGKQDAAKENGIDDFMWIAVIDGKTDECCFVRDGLSSSEIENRLEDGRIDQDECDAIVAPAHFNCRCDSAPMTADLPESPGVDYGSFDEWLEAKAA